MKKIATQRRQPPMSVGWLVTMTVAAFYLYEYYLRVIPSTMMPYFIAQFGASVGEIGHIETAYYWTYVPLQIFVGTILDIFGVRKPLFLALASCTLGCILFSFDSSINWLIAGRALMGFGSAFGFVAVLKAATVWLPKKHFPLAIGIATGMGSLGAIFGKVLTTKIITDYGFISLFDIIIQSSIALIIISYFLVYDKQKLNKKSNFRRKFSALAQTIITVIRTPQIWIDLRYKISKKLVTSKIGKLRRHLSGP